MIINDLDSCYIVFDTKNRNTELDTLLIKSRHNSFYIMDTYNLLRFVDAQDSNSQYDYALEEIRCGRKRSHWIWFVLKTEDIHPPKWGMSVHFSFSLVQL